MGWLTVTFAIIASVLFYGTGHTILLVIAIVFGIADFWSWGVMHNYATDQAKRRSSYSGGFYDFTRAEVDSVPNWITGINMAFSLANVALLIVAVVLRFA